LHDLCYLVCMKEKEINLTEEQILRINGCLVKWHPTKGDTRWGKEYIGWGMERGGLAFTINEIEEIEDIALPTSAEIADWNKSFDLHSQAMTEYYSTPGYKGD